MLPSGWVGLAFLGRCGDLENDICHLTLLCLEWEISSGIFQSSHRVTAALDSIASKNPADQATASQCHVIKNQKNRFPEYARKFCGTANNIPPTKAALFLLIPLPLCL